VPESLWTSRVKRDYIAGFHLFWARLSAQVYVFGQVYTVYFIAMDQRVWMKTKHSNTRLPIWVKVLAE
jgi:cytochrome c biogenesis factor